MANGNPNPSRRRPRSPIGCVEAGYSKVVAVAVIAVLAGVVVFALSSMISDGVLTLLPYTILALLHFFGCARVLKLLGDEDKTFVTHLQPARLEWAIRFL